MFFEPLEERQLLALTIADATVVEGDAGSTDLVFNVTNSPANPLQVTVEYSTADGTAQDGLDYVGILGATLTFAPLQIVQTITIPVTGDLLDEPNEVFTVTLSNPTSDTIADGTATGTIDDNDPQPTVSIGDQSVTEGNAGATNAVFQVTLSAPSGQTILVNFNTSDVSATAGEDYTFTSGTLTFVASDTVELITVPVLGDLLDEIDETFLVLLSSPSNVTILDGQGLGTIGDDDPQPTVSIGDQSVTEGNAGATNAVFQVTLSAPSGQTILVNFNTSDVSATAGQDYTFTSGTLTFVASDTVELITVPVLGDLLDEIDETFLVLLSNPSNVTILDGQGLGTIGDDDPQPTLSINDVTVTEGTNPSAIFTVTLSAASGLQVTVAFSTADGTAVAVADYQATSGTLTFAALQTTQSVTVPIVNDTLDEANETFVVNLATAVNAGISDGQGVGTIQDNDPQPTVSISDQTVIEGDAGPTNAVFQVTLSGPSGQTILVNFNTSDLSATAGQDYTFTSGTLTFAANDTVELITVPVLGDLFDEIDETFLVLLSNPSNVTILDGQGVGTIIDDDSLLSISDQTVVEGNAGFTDAIFQVTLSSASGLQILVNFNTSDVTATAGPDYLPTSGTLTFDPGETVEMITVQVRGDTLDEADETFRVLLNANVITPLDVPIQDGQGVVTIINDDAPLSTADVSVTEGNSGFKNLVLTVLRTGAINATSSVQFNTANGTALAGQDYLATSGTITFLPTESTKPITVEIRGDLFPEPDETFSVNLSNPVNLTITDGQAIVAIVNDDSYLVTGADAGGGPHVKVYHEPTGALVHSFFAYDPGFTGGVRVATADVSGDGVHDIITGAGPGGGPHVRVFNGIDAAPLPGAIGSFMAYNPLFGGGVFVAAGDVNGDGRADIVTGAGAGGGPHVRSFNGQTGGQLPNFIGSFMAYSAAMTAGVRVAVGDVNTDGHADIITGSGAFFGWTGPHQREVKVYSGENVANPAVFFLTAFDPFPSEQSYIGGVHLAFGRTGIGGLGQIIVSKANGDGRPNPAFASSIGNAGKISVFDFANLVPREIMLNPYAGFNGSVRIAVVDAVFGGSPRLVTGAGPGGGPHVKVFDTTPLANGSLVLSAIDEFFAYDSLFTGGIFVGG